MTAVETQGVRRKSAASLMGKNESLKRQRMPGQEGIIQVAGCESRNWLRGCRQDKSLAEKSAPNIRLDNLFRIALANTLSRSK